MNIQTAGYLAIFGILLVLLGLVGYVTHPETARTALVFGGGFGALWMLLGMLSDKGRRWIWPAALSTTTLLVVGGAWRGSLSWLAVANGQSEKVFASVLITMTLAVSVTMLFLLLRDRKRSRAQRPAGGAP